jgi:HSP20 family protein
MDFSLFPRDLFAELDRLQRQIQQSFDISPSIRGVARGAFPPLNVASTAQSAEIYAFAPGLDPKSIDVQIERGVLSISGERADTLPRDEERSTVHVNERFAGRFHRVITLADDLDSGEVRATYQDGVLHVSVARQKAAQPRRIEVS